VPAEPDAYRYRERPVPYLWLACCVGLLIAAVAIGVAVWTTPVVIVVAVVIVAVALVGAVRFAGQQTIAVTSATIEVAGQTIARDDIEGLVRVSGGGHGLRLSCTNGTAITVPTRHPEALKRALDLSDDMPVIRPADPDEYPKLFEIERRADVLFAVAGRGPLPDPATAHELIHEAKAVFVAGRPAVGFARVDVVDGLAHLEQLSVVPSQMRRGIGSALLEAACAWALEQGYPAMTLTTFADVEWNAPFYAERGFAPTTDLGPELAELWDWENDLGLDRIGTRVVMRRDLVAASLAD